MNDLDFLLSDEQMAEVEPQIHIPTEGFATTGFIAQWMAKVLYTFMVEGVDLEMENRVLKDAGEDTYPVPTASQKFDSGWYRYWYERDSEAREATNLLKKHEGLDRKPSVNTVWRWEARSETCLNLSEAAAEAFGDVLAWECQITTLGSTFRRHEFHMVSLPAAINAVAEYLGLTPPGFPLDELTEADIVYTPEFEIAMIGIEPQERANGEGYQHVNIKGGYTNSVLWQRREILWKALGEDDARKFRVKGAGTKFDTMSDTLNKCLQIVEKPWAKSVWGLLVPVRDPRLDATMKSGTRLSIPALVKMYKSQAEAQEAAQELTGAQTEAGVETGPALPQMWAGQKDAWLEYVGQVRDKLGGKPPVPPNVQAVVVELFGSIQNTGAEVSDFINWL